ncbi:hypothetical protein SCA6_017599 [Theobroma cacao]
MTYSRVQEDDIIVNTNDISTPSHDAQPPIQLDQQCFQPPTDSLINPKGVSMPSQDFHAPIQFVPPCIQPPTTNQISPTQVNNSDPLPSPSQANISDGPTKPLDLPIPLAVYGAVERTHILPIDVQGINLVADLNGGPYLLRRSNRIDSFIGVPDWLLPIYQAFNSKASSSIRGTLEKSFSSSSEDSRLEISNDFSNENSLSLAEEFSVSSNGGKNGSKRFNKLRKKGIKKLCHKSKVDSIVPLQIMSDSPNSSRNTKAEDTWNLEYISFEMSPQLLLAVFFAVKDANCCPLQEANSIADAFDGELCFDMFFCVAIPSSKGCFGTLPWFLDDVV